MKQIALLFLALVGIMLLVYWLGLPGSTDIIKNYTAGTVPTQQKSDTVKIGKNEFKVEIADTEEKRQIGLSQHTSLEKDTGMLFVFDQKNIRPDFWMKGMTIPIDIIWINDGKVVLISADVPTVRSGISEAEIPRYSPNQQIDYVFEIGAGVSKEKNIKVGDSIELPQGVK